MFEGDNEADDDGKDRTDADEPLTPIHGERGDRIDGPRTLLTSDDWGTYGYFERPAKGEKITGELWDVISLAPL